LSHKRVFSAAGDPVQDHNIQILVKVCKLETFCSNVTMAVKVYPPTQDDELNAFESMQVAGEAGCDC